MAPIAQRSQRAKELDRVFAVVATALKVNPVHDAAAPPRGGEGRKRNKTIHLRLHKNPAELEAAKKAPSSRRKQHVSAVIKLPVPWDRPSPSLKPPIFAGSKEGYAHREIFCKH